MSRKATPSSSVVCAGNFAEMNSHSSVNGMTPSSGPHSRCTPPSSAMITTSKVRNGLNAIDGST